MKKLSFRALVVIAWLLAVANYVVNNPWGKFTPPIARALNDVAGVVGSITFVLWVLVLIWAFRAYGKKAWWLILSAPLAISTFLSVAVFVIGSLIFRH